MQELQKFFAKVCWGTKKVSEVASPEATVLNIERKAHDTGKIMCTVQIRIGNGQTQKLELMLDTGSTVSILPMSVYKQFFSHTALSAPKLNLVCFGGTAIRVKELYIMQQGSAVLGRDSVTVTST